MGISQQTKHFGSLVKLLLHQMYNNTLPLSIHLIEKTDVRLPTMRFCILIVRSSTTSGSFRLRWRALFVSPRSSSVAAADGGGEGLVCAVPCRADATPCRHRDKDFVDVDCSLSCNVPLCSMQVVSMFQQCQHNTAKIKCNSPLPGPDQCSCS